MNIKRLACYLAGWLMVCSGCGPPANSQRLREEILGVDPAFSEVLEKRDEQANRIKLLEREYDLKRTQVEQQIVQLRNDLRASRKQVNEKITRIRGLLKPNIERVELARSVANEERRAKRAQRATLGRSLSHLRKSLKQSQVPLDPAQRSRLSQEEAELLSEIQRLDHELAALDEHLRILQIKQLLLRL